MSLGIDDDDANEDSSVEDRHSRSSRFYRISLTLAFYLDIDNKAVSYFLTFIFLPRSELSVFPLRALTGKHEKPLRRSKKRPNNTYLPMRCHIHETPSEVFLGIQIVDSRCLTRRAYIPLRSSPRRDQHVAPFPE